MSQATPLTEHPCDGCYHYERGMCVTNSAKFPDCWEPGKIIIPLERKLSEFKLKGEDNE